jgi:hypothetical protein
MSLHLFDYTVPKSAQFFSKDDIFETFKQINIHLPNLTKNNNIYYMESKSSLTHCDNTLTI